MAKHAYKEPSTELSATHKCSQKGCGKPIKARLVRIKVKAPRYCYNHWMEIVNARREVKK